MVLPAIMWLVRSAVTIMPDCISRRVVLRFTTLPISCAMLLIVRASKAMPPASFSPKPLDFSLRQEDGQGKYDDLHSTYHDGYAEQVVRELYGILE